MTTMMTTTIATEKKATTMKDAGFTLIELLVAAAMIGILATLSLANFAMFKHLVYNTTAASDGRNLSPAVQMASSEAAPATLITLDGAGGRIAQLPGATFSPGTLGTIEIAANQYRISTYQPRGDACYTLSNTSRMAVTAGPCAL